MFSFSSFASLGSGPLSFAVDLGSSSAKVAAFEEGDGLRPPRIKKKFVVEGVRYQKGGKLRGFVSELVRAAGKKPAKILVGIGSGFADLRIERWTSPVNAAKPAAVSRKGLRHAFEKLFEEHRSAEHALLAYPLAVFVNGYTPPSPLPEEIPGVLAREISFRTLSISLREDAGSELGALKKELGGVAVDFVPLAVSLRELAVRSLHAYDCLLVDVGAFHTVILFIKDGAIVRVSSFPSGAHKFVASVARASSLSEAEAQDLLRDYAGERSGEGVSEILAAALSREADAWKESFRVAVESFYDAGPLPPLVLLTGGGAYIPEIAGFLRRSEWFENYSYASLPEVRLLEGKRAFGGDTLGGHLGGAQDAGLASLLVYLARHEPVL